MRKLMALYTNEWIKMTRKVSVIVLSSLIVISAFAIPGISKAIGMVNQMTSISMNTYREDEKKWMEDESRSALLSYEALIKESDNEMERIQLSKDYPEETKKMLLADQEEQKAQNQDTLEIYSLAIDKGIYPLFQFNYLTESVASILELKSTIRSGEAYLIENPNEEIKNGIEIARVLVDKYQKLLENPAFPTYVALETEKIELNPYMSSDDKQAMKEILEIRMKLQPEGDLEQNEESMYKQELLNNIANIKRSAASGLDYTTSWTQPAPMNPTKKAEMIEREMILDYRLANDIFPINTSYETRVNDIKSVFSVGMFLITLLMMILAGSSISQEIATGSIKSLIIAPVRRWKIFAAKILSLLSLTIVAMLILYVCGILSQGIFNGFSGNLPYVYVSNGECITVPFPIYMFQYLFCSFPQVTIYLIMAFMLSTITRNTAVSVALPLGFMFIGNIVKQIISVLPNLEIIRFIPYLHLDFADRVLPFGDLMTGMRMGMLDMMSAMMSSSIVPPSISFSLIYLAVVAFCMIYIAFDHFTREDIR